MERSNLSKFCSDSEGTVAIVFSLCFIVLVCAAALAVDTVRGHQAENELTQALDTTALATARAMRLEGLDDSKLEERANAYFEQNFAGRSSYAAKVSDFKLSLDHDSSTATVAAAILLPSFIARLMSNEDFKIARSSTAQFDLKDLELSLTLDTSGSMQGQKIADLKAAAKDMLDIVLDESNDITENKIGIAPYSTAINAGSYAERVTGNAGNNNCVSERIGAASDESPLSNPLGRKAWSCPPAAIVPLLKDKNRLKDEVDSLVASGATAGHLGIAWSWYILSPKWAAIWPSESQPKPYSDKKTLKAAVILTDGEFNTAYEPANGDSVAQAKQLCDGMKADGITLFTIGFDAPAAAKDTLKYCASSEIYFFDAQQGDQLRAAFTTIAHKLIALRLTN